MIKSETSISIGTTVNYRTKVAHRSFKRSRPGRNVLADEFLRLTNSSQASVPPESSETEEDWGKALAKQAEVSE